MKEPILCYVKGPWAYFTTQPLKKQWGDDWDDAPYEHNAGEPYGPGYFHYCDERGSVKNERDWNADGTPKWEIIKVAWDGDFDTPDHYAINTNWSVRNINSKYIPWLESASFMNKRILIWAGTKFSAFKKLIKKGGGKVYVED